MWRLGTLFLSFVAYWLFVFYQVVFVLVAVKVDPFFWILALLCILGQWGSILIFKEQWENK